MLTVKPRTTEVVLYQGDDYDRFTELSAAVEAAAMAADRSGARRLGDDEPTTAAAAEYDAFVEEAVGRGVTVRLEAIPRKDFRALVVKHPAREGNDVDKGWGFNFETMCDDLVPASIPLTDQFSSEAERETFLDSLSDADYSRLYTAAVEVNQGGGPDPFVKLSSRLARTSGETQKPPARLG